jgi:hypothetical protein
MQAIAEAALAPPIKSMGLRDFPWWPVVTAGLKNLNRAINGSA